jgi:hypothetical protein
MDFSVFVFGFPLRAVFAAIKAINHCLLIETVKKKLNLWKSVIFIAQIKKNIEKVSGELLLYFVATINLFLLFD